MTIYKEIEDYFLNSLDINNEEITLESLISKSTLESIKNNIETFFQNLLDWVKQTAYKLSLKLKNIMVTNEGYRKTLIEYMNKYKPQYEKIRAIGFSYNLPELQKYSKKLVQISNLVVSYGNKNDEDNPLLLDKSDFDKWIIKQFEFDSSNYSDFFSHLKSSFRGEKKDREITISELPKYTYACLNYRNLYSAINTDMNNISLMIKSAKTGLRGKILIGNNSLNTDEKKSIAKKISNLGRVVKFRSSMVSFLSSLISEYILFSREITKRFYKIHYII